MVLPVVFLTVAPLVVLWLVRLLSLGLGMLIVARRCAHEGVGRGAPTAEAVVDHAVPTVVCGVCGCRSWPYR